MNELKIEIIKDKKESNDDSLLLSVLNNKEWPIYKSILDQMKADKIISTSEWYQAIILMRKKLGLIIIS